MFWSSMRKEISVLPEGQFTLDEETRIYKLREQFLANPDPFKLTMQFRRLEFARWLVTHGYLDEERGRTANWGEGIIDTDVSMGALHLEDPRACMPITADAHAD